MARATVRVQHTSKTCGASGKPTAMRYLCARLHCFRARNAMMHDDEKCMTGKKSQTEAMPQQTDDVFYTVQAHSFLDDGCYQVHAHSSLLKS
jgi:hypothetical protein